jgi:hypothetical protein
MNEINNSAALPYNSLVRPDLNLPADKTPLGIVTAYGMSYVLNRPLYPLNSITIQSESSDAVTTTPVDPVNRAGEWVYSLALDKRVIRASAPPGFYNCTDIIAHIDAPGLTLRNIHIGEGDGLLYLSGNSPGSKLVDCDFSTLELTAGLFDGLDISQTSIQDFWMNLDRVCAKGVRFSAETHIVRLHWKFQRQCNEINTNPEFVDQILDAWPSGISCDKLARYIVMNAVDPGPLFCGGSRTIDAIVASKVLRSKAVNSARLCRILRRHLDKVCVAAGLVARRNQLQRGLLATPISTGSLPNDPNP